MINIWGWCKIPLCGWPQVRGCSREGRNLCITELQLKNTISMQKNAHREACNCRWLRYPDLPTSSKHFVQIYYSGYNNAKFIFSEFSFTVFYSEIASETYIVNSIKYKGKYRSEGFVSFALNNILYAIRDSGLHSCGPYASFDTYSVIYMTIICHTCHKYGKNEINGPMTYTV